MYFFNIKALAKQLKENTLTSYEEAQYFFGTMLLFAWISYKSQGATILALLCGTLYWYSINKKGDNKDFIKRVTVLAFPTLFIWYLYGLLITAIAFPVYAYIDKAPHIHIVILATLAIIMIVTFYAWMISFFRIIGKNLRDISQHSN